MPCVTFVSAATPTHHNRQPNSLSAAARDETPLGPRPAVMEQQEARTEHAATIDLTADDDVPEVPPGGGGPAPRKMLTCAGNGGSRSAALHGPGADDAVDVVPWLAHVEDGTTDHDGHLLLRRG